MNYEFGLTNYILHELGNNLSDEDIVFINEDKAFNNKLSNNKRIDREINKIKSITDKYNDILEIKNKNIKEIIVCIDLLLGIEVSFKTSFLVVASYLLDNDSINKILDIDSSNYDDTLKKSDKIIKKIIVKYLEELCI